MKTQMKINIGLLILWIFFLGYDLVQENYSFIGVPLDLIFIALSVYNLKTTIEGE